MTERIRRRRARASFEAKVILLEQYSAAGEVPERTPVLRHIQDVQQWEDRELGLVRWSSYSVAAPSGKHADLRDRLDVVLPAIVKLQSGASAKAKKPRRGKVISRRQIENEPVRLAIQNNLLIYRQTQLEDEVKRQRHLVSERDREIAELTIKLNKLARFPRS
jgi:hypothetical protein